MKELKNKIQNLMNPTLSKFSIKGLHGYLDLDLEIKDNKLILVAENGLGKTTLVNILFYFLSGQWGKLDRYRFDIIELKLDDSRFTYKKPIFDKSHLYNEFIQKLSEGLRPIAHVLIDNYDFNEFTKVNSKYLTDEVIPKLDGFNIPEETISQVVDFFVDFIKIKSYNIEREKTSKGGIDLEDLLLLSLKDKFEDVMIIYLPTYRRIERELEEIFPQFESSKFIQRSGRVNRRQKTENFLELIKFGMSDVKELLSDKCIELKDLFQNNLNKKITGSYLEDILSQKYFKVNINQTQIFNKDALQYILKRLDDNVLSKQGKESLVKFIENLKENPKLNGEDKVNAYFVGKLFQIFEEQQKAEKDINRFIELCNSYLSNSKRMYYDNDRFEVKIELTHKDKKYPIEFEDLSSGEKQIVSLFSHLVLSNRKFFMIIDEPELSLSVVWQEKLLPDIVNNENCVGLLAVTHSPFIFKNELKAYTHSMDEFIQ